MAKGDFNKLAMQLYWIRTSAWMFSCIFAAYFRLPFPKNASVRLLLIIFKTYFKLNSRTSPLKCNIYFWLLYCNLENSLLCHILCRLLWATFKTRIPRIRTRMWRTRMWRTWMWRTRWIRRTQRIWRMRQTRPIRRTRRIQRFRWIQRIRRIR